MTLYGQDHPEPDLDEAPSRDMLALLRTGSWLDSQTFPPLSWAVPGVIPEGLSLLVGPPKVGKSWLSLSLALACASGGVALGHIHVDKRPVLYLALEDGDRRMKARCKVLLNEAPTPPEFTYLTRLTPSDLLATLDQWVARYNGEALVMLDTLGKVMPPAMAGESAYQRDYRVGGRLKEAADTNPGMAIVVVHHDRKAEAADFVDGVSGTHGLAGAADTIILLARKRQESSGLLKVTGRDVDENEYALTFNDATWSLDGDNLAEAASTARDARTVVGLGDHHAAVVHYVNTHADGVRPPELADALGLDAATARQYLKRAFDSKRIEKKGRGVYVPVTSVTSVTSPGQGRGDNVTALFTSVTTERRRSEGTSDGSDGSDTSLACRVCHEPMAYDDGSHTHPDCGDRP